MGAFLVSYGQWRSLRRTVDRVQLVDVALLQTVGLRAGRRLVFAHVQLGQRSNAIGFERVRPPEKAVRGELTFVGVRVKVLGIDSSVQRQTRAGQVGGNC